MRRRDFISSVPLAFLHFHSKQVAAEKKEEWIIYEGKEDGKAIIGSVLGKLPSSKVRERLSLQVSVSWTYVTNETGMLLERDFPLKNRIEIGIEKILGEESALGVTRTGNGRRTVCYFVVAGSSYRERLSKFFEGFPGRNLEVVEKVDPNWSEVRFVLDNLRSR